MRKAQSPYSVNMLAALAARVAVNDREYVSNYVKEVLAARDLLYAEPRAARHSILSQRRKLRPRAVRHARG